MRLTYAPIRVWSEPMLPFDIAVYFASATLLGLAGYTEQITKRRVERPGPEYANLIFTIGGRLGGVWATGMMVYAFFLFHWPVALLIVIGSFFAAPMLWRLLPSTLDAPVITFFSFIAGVALFAVTML